MILELLDQVVQNVLEVLFVLLHFSHDTSVNVPIKRMNFTRGRVANDWPLKRNWDQLPLFVILLVGDFLILIDWWEDTIMVHDVEVEFV